MSESFCLCNFSKNSVRPESIVNVLSELAAPWENCSQRMLGQLVDLNCAWRKKKLIFQAITETIANLWQDLYCLRL